MVLGSPKVPFSLLVIHGFSRKVTRTRKSAMTIAEQITFIFLVRHHPIAKNRLTFYRLGYSAPKIFVLLYANPKGALTQQTGISWFGAQYSCAALPDDPTPGTGEPSALEALKPILKPLNPNP